MKCLSDVLVIVVVVVVGVVVVQFFRFCSSSVLRCAVLMFGVEACIFLSPICLSFFSMFHVSVLRVSACGSSVSALPLVVGRNAIAAESEQV